MKFEHVLPHFRAGQRIRRASWAISINPKRAVHPLGKRPKYDTVYYNLTLKDIVADDWEVYPDDVPAINVPDPHHKVTK